MSPLRFLSLMLLCTGCAAPGLVSDRLHDAADVVTLTVGLGTGAKARVGPVQAALIKTSDIAGLRAGSWFADGLDLVYNDEFYVLPLPLRGMARRRWWVLPYGSEVFSHGTGSVSRRRGKDVGAQSPFLLLAFSKDPSFYTQIELALGLGLVGRIGVNPGEFLDWLLGFGGVDLYNDDLSKRERVPADE